MGVIDMKNKAELIFLPFPAKGHIASALQLAQLLINRHNHLSITVLSFEFPTLHFANSYIRSIVASQPRIKLIDLPQVEPPPQDLRLVKSIEHYVFTFVQSLIPHIKVTLQNILSSYPDSDSSQVLGLILDFFCVSMIDVAEELGIPSYLYSPPSTAFIGYMFSLQKRGIEDVFDDSDPLLLNIPGFSNLVPLKVLPSASFNKDGGYVTLYKLAKRFGDVKGIIVNTFSELEHYAIDALSDGKTPPIYAVGPLIDLKAQHHDENILDQSEHDKIMKWLDEQPPSSVVFLCFGSRGSFSPPQTREIALALKHGGFRFLWAMRSDQSTDKTEESPLPEGFLESMEGKGMICGWAPQVEVLAHKAIGGFVSHCGWNSILESLWFGVPILTWPIYAEQQLNAFTMVKEFRLAVELRLDYTRASDIVVAGEIEKGMKHLMDRDNVVHNKVQEVKEMARKAVSYGGSSFINVGKFIDHVIGSN